MNEVDEGRIEALLGAMTLADKAAMAAGSALWYSTPLPDLDVPAFKMSDGPNGVRGDGATAGVGSTCFPVGVALGATWDEALLEEVGAALGEECRAKGVDVLLGPTINLHRTPLAGRNFECYAEDPLLSGRLAVAYTRGVQSRDVAVCLKHFVCNDSEFERHSISALVDPVPLRELYLRPFERAIREAGAWTVMSAYNGLNGEPCSGNRTLLRDILKTQWGFDGVVISDWNGTYDTVAPARAGLDLEMPGPPRRMGDRLLAAVRRGEVAEAELDDKVRRQLRLMQRTGRLDRPGPRAQADTEWPEHLDLARRVAAAGTVLLRNEGLLPLTPTGTIALIGPNAAAPQYQGGGSSHVNTRRALSPADGLAAAFGGDAEIVVAPGCLAHRYLPLVDQRLCTPDAEQDRPGWRTTFFAGTALQGDPVLVTHPRRSEMIWFGAFSPAVPAEFSVRAETLLRPRLAGVHEFSLISTGRARLYVDDVLVVDNDTDWSAGDAYFGNGSLEVRGSVELAAGAPVRIRVECVREAAPELAGLRIGMLEPVPGDLLAEAEALAARADLAVLCVGLNSDWETEGADRVDMRLPGEQETLIRRVAAVQPRTLVVLNAGSPIDCSGWIDDVAAVLQPWYPGSAFGAALADVVSGAAEPGGRLPMTVPRRYEDHPALAFYPGENGVVRYGEGLLMGYRGYDAAATEPLFPFGFGLGYTRFALADPEVEIAPDGELSLRLSVSNLGERAGSTVVQVYLEPAHPEPGRPPRELCAFARVALAPGESRRLEIPCPAEDRRVWDEVAGAFVDRVGGLRLRIGESSRDLPLTLELP